MSQVITIPDLQGAIFNLSSYMDNFWGFLEATQIKSADMMIPDFSAFTDNPAAETARMFRDWMQDQHTKWGGFNRRWKFHFFETNLRSQYGQDWLPPIAYAQQAFPRYALPQFPQQRVKIPDPTDRFGKKRSIRVHFKQKDIVR